MLKEVLRSQGAVATAQPLDASFVGFVSKANSLKLGSVIPAFLSHFSVKVTSKYLQLFLPAPDLGLELVRVGEERGCTDALCWSGLSRNSELRVMALVPLLLLVVFFGYSSLFISSKEKCVFLIKVGKILGNLHHPTLCPTNL